MDQIGASRGTRGPFCQMDGSRRRGHTACNVPNGGRQQEPFHKPGSTPDVVRKGSSALGTVQTSKKGFEVIQQRAGVAAPGWPRLGRVVFGAARCVHVMQAWQVGELARRLVRAAGPQVYRRIEWEPRNLGEEELAAVGRFRPEFSRRNANLLDFSRFLI